MGGVCCMICLMMFNECYTQQGAVWAGCRELRTQGAIMQLGKKMKVPGETALSMP